jgi:hypothetical protein
MGAGGFRTRTAYDIISFVLELASYCMCVCVCVSAEDGANFKLLRFADIHGSVFRVSMWNALVREIPKYDGLIFHERKKS